jgi:50S ribosomal protein L16 3-hydroxylase
MTKTIPGGMPAVEFLTEYWQKKPCFIGQAVTDFQPFISKEEFLSLASRDEVESRLVLESRGESPWEVIHGPFEENELAALPPEHWTLLIQNTELYFPAASQFLERFNFIPGWRIDDLMISFAPLNGSVGPHLDSYDVFLFQAMGKRKWSISSDLYNDDDFIEGLDIRVLENFSPDKEWILEPGDMLYLPPGIAHYGVALEDCMTFSIGFRAPSNHELISQYIDDLLINKKENRYTDPDLSLQAHSGEISAHHLGNIRAFMESVIPREIELENWFGKYVTRLPENFKLDIVKIESDITTFLHKVQGEKYLTKRPGCRSVFISRENYFELYVNGEEYRVSQASEQFVHNFTENQNFENPLRNENRTDSELCTLLFKLYLRSIISTESEKNHG